MYELSKSIQRRLHDSNFINRYFKGQGIDIGSGNDSLAQYVELFPLITGVVSWDKEQGDAACMYGVGDESYDFVHSSHCLEDMQSPYETIRSWWRILKPGGYLVVTVPDEDMYEQGEWPSTFNPDHKVSFAVWKNKPKHPRSHNVIDLIRDILEDDVEIIKIERLTGTYRYSLPRMDQTRTPIGEAAIEFILRKRPRTETEQKSTESEVRASFPKKQAIALHRPGAIGDIIMTLQLVPLLKQKYPDADIHYFCNPAIAIELKDLMKAAGISSAIDCELFEANRYSYTSSWSLIGYPLAEGYPEKPMARHLLEYFALELELCQPQDRFSGGLPHLTLPPPSPHPDPSKPFATLHAQAGWSAYKNWPLDRWEDVLKSCDFPVYQIGSATDTKIPGAIHNFMGQPLQYSIALMAHARMHMGVDSWTNHLTNIYWEGKGKTPAVILWGSTQYTAAGYDYNTNISLGLACQPCFREDPAISKMPRGPCINPFGQVYEKPLHACMHGITVEQVVGAVKAMWETAT